MDDLLRACVTSVTRPLTRSSVELRPPSRQGPAFGRIVETTQGRPGDLKGTPSPGPQRLWTGARGSQGSSGRPATRGTPQYHMHVISAGKGLTGHNAMNPCNCQIQIAWLREPDGARYLAEPISVLAPVGCRAVRCRPPGRGGAGLKCQNAQSSNLMRGCRADR